MEGFPMADWSRFPEAGLALAGISVPFSLIRVYGSRGGDFYGDVWTREGQRGDVPRDLRDRQRGNLDPGLRQRDHGGESADRRNAGVRNPRADRAAEKRLRFPGR